MDHTRTYPLPADNGIHHLQIAIDGNDGQVDHGAIGCRPDEVLAEQYYAETVADHAGKTRSGYLHRVGDDQKEAAEKIKSILVDNQYLLLVLLGDKKRVEDDGVASSSHNRHDYHRNSHVEIGSE